MNDLLVTQQIYCLWPLFLVEMSATVFLYTYMKLYLEISVEKACTLSGGLSATVPWSCLFAD